MGKQNDGRDAQVREKTRMVQICKYVYDAGFLPPPLPSTAYLAMLISIKKWVRVFVCTYGGERIFGHGRGTGYLKNEKRKACPSRVKKALQL